MRLKIRRVGSLGRLYLEKPKESHTAEGLPESSIVEIACIDAMLRASHALGSQWDREFLWNVRGRLLRGTKLTPKQHFHMKRIFNRCGYVYDIPGVIEGG